MIKNHTVITGLGCLCAAGENLDRSWQNMMRGTALSCLPTKFRAEISRLSPVFEVSPEAVKKSDIFPDREIGTTFCVDLFLAACVEALDRAALTPGDLAGQRIGVCVGTTVGCTLNNEPFYREFKAGSQPGLGAIRRFLCNNPALFLNEALDLQGPACTINNACSSGTAAIGQAREWINDGLCDIVIAGGTDELSRIPYLGFSSLMNTSESPCKPFDAQRNGLNLGEGAGVLIVESKNSAHSRGAKALAEIAGYGTCADAYHPTAPHPQGLGLERAIHSALDGIDPGNVCCINAHATATTANDSVEGSTLARIFPGKPPVFGTKSYTGHSLGAAGAIEAVFAINGLLRGEIPPTAGFSEPDPACAITPTETVTRIEGEYALSTSLAFGGINSAVLFKVGRHGS